MRVLVTGTGGFIGRNLELHLKGLHSHEVVGFRKGEPMNDLRSRVEEADAIVHLAGVNRPKDDCEFYEGNARLTEQLCSYIEATGRNIPLIVASSIQANRDNPYGKSKREAEEFAVRLSERTGNSVVIYRLANVFGKWCRPNYNSVVATFCHNVANDLPIQINNPETQLNLIYVDDVISAFISDLEAAWSGLRYGEVEPSYAITLGGLAAQIEAFKNCRSSLVSERVGSGFVRALYATYVSYLPPSKFAYDLPRHGDERGVFVELLKTQDSGQFSFFSAHPGVTRGGHYHHTKTEKFLVIKGTARFGFRHMATDERYALVTSGNEPRVVDTVPGWTHDITNIGEGEMLVMLWANEIFDRNRPDTFSSKV